MYTPVAYCCWSRNSDLETQTSTSWLKLSHVLSAQQSPFAAVRYNQPFLICCRAAFQHARELLKMQHPLHMELLPLVECALAALRMSCERFFLLISVFAAYLLFSTKVPHWFKLIVRFNHRLSKIFQKVAHSLHALLLILAPPWSVQRLVHLLLPLHLSCSIFT